MFLFSTNKHVFEFFLKKYKSSQGIDLEGCEEKPMKNILFFYIKKIILKKQLLIYLLLFKHVTQKIPKITTFFT
jgi:hypothetical protein